ncbi:hypothetical protein [Lutibaculum baratangense]|uniref:Transmembrane protein n=1 Tax=Lutibaculum baratangense AMV1 TaxID=631454 RepID=V4RHA7_9HYPH|nr:hypothetical protein [Lutibaculum baratangense]ESR24744.1 hypothetical protein N177_2067 [Lutibaculum baratangense AMV1]
MFPHLFLKSLGILSLIFGAIVLPTPIPLGAPLIAFGAALLVMTSRTARSILRRLRREYRGLNDLVARVEPRLARPLRVFLRRTRPATRRPRLQPPAD